MAGHHTANTCAFPGLPNELAFKIFENLDQRSLLSCRLVSQGCCQVSSTILQSRPTVSVLFYCPITLDKEGSVSAFIKCFKQSRKFCHPFPYVNFVLVGFYGNTKFRGIPICPDLVHFFALSNVQSDAVSGSGLLIKSLHFDVALGPTTMVDLEDLIFRKTPHLTTLNLKLLRGDLVQQTRAGGTLSSSSNNNSETTLSSLQVLQLHGCLGPDKVEFVANLLRVAPNLQRIEGVDDLIFEKCPYLVFHADHLRPFIDAKKLHLLKQCDLQLRDVPVAPGVLVRDKLPGFQPTFLRLENLGHRQATRRSWVSNIEQTKENLREVLWTVKDDVEELRVDNSLGLLDKASLPPLSKLRRIQWDLENFDGPILPAGIRNHGEIFPILEKISLEFSSERGISPEGENIAFPDLGHIPVIPAVHSLEVESYDGLTGQCLVSMALMCPNLQSLELMCYGDESGLKFAQVGPVIWESMKMLKILVLDNGLLEKGNSLKMVESTFTGFPLSTVEELEAAAPENSPRVEEVEHLRINSSILQMTVLEKLVINRGRNDHPGSVLRLSSKYAFDLMPQLTVQFCPAI